MCWFPERNVPVSVLNRLHCTLHYRWNSSSSTQHLNSGHLTHIEVFIGALFDDVSHDHYLGQRLIQQGFIYHECMGCVCVCGCEHGSERERERVVCVCVDNSATAQPTLTHVVTGTCQQRSCFPLFSGAFTAQRDLLGGGDTHGRAICICNLNLKNSVRY